MDKIDVRARSGVIVFLIVLVLLFASLFATTSVYIIRCKSNKNNEYNTAIAEIKKCLKDENWLVKKDIASDKNADGVYQKIYFTKLNNENNKPYFVVRTVFEDSSYLRIVSYDGKEVTVNGHCGADYGSTKIDVNNNIVEVNATMFLAYYKIENGTFELIEKAENDEDGTDITRKALAEKYNKYNFTDINTELTSQNVDTYVK